MLSGLASTLVSRHEVARFVAISLALVVAVLMLATSPVSGAPGSLPDPDDPACARGPVVVGDVLEGTPCADVLVAPRGVTFMEGGGGDDLMVAAGAVTEMSGGDGNDTIVGSDTVVEINGGDGDDTIYGDHPPKGLELPATASRVRRISSSRRNVGLSKASIHMDEDYGVDDQVFDGGGDDDTVFGQRGNDLIQGGSGNDRLFGSVGDDLVEGEWGDDLLAGGNGSDNARGGEGNDLVRGDTIGDIRETKVDLLGYDGPDGLTGGNGVDTISFATAVTPGFRNVDVPFDPASISSGFPGESGERGVFVDLNADPVVAENGRNKDGGGGDLIPASDFENVIGSPYADYIKGNGQNNVIVGGGGGDVLLGQDGDDTLYGGAHGDDLRGGLGNNTAYGETGVDSCKGMTTEITCDNDSESVIQRNPALLTVGLVETEWATGVQKVYPYVLGSSSNNNVTTEFYPNAAPRPKIVFKSHLGVIEDRPKDGCKNSENDLAATCEFFGDRTLDSVQLYGAAGADSVSVNNAGLPETTSAFLLGGLGGDPNIAGSDNTEDVLIDGPSEDVANDKLFAYDQTDALLQGMGADELDGGAGGDTLLASEVCAGNILNGGTGSDNASFSSFPTGARRSLTQGIFADIVSDRVGVFDSNPNASPACPPGMTLDSIPGIENLEGTQGQDRLVGGDGQNQLLGRSGRDIFDGGAGPDVILTASGDDDLRIDCGTDSDQDELKRDREETWNSFRDRENITDCEKPTDANADYVNPPVDVDMMCLSQASAFWRFDERSGATAHRTRGSFNGTYSQGMSLNPTKAGAIADSEGTAVELNGSTSWIDLGTGVDPANSTGYTIETWVKFTQADDGGLRYVFSRRDPNTNPNHGVFLGRLWNVLVFASTNASGTYTAVAPNITDHANPGWHHIVGTMTAADKTMRLYVDGVLAGSKAYPAAASIFPPALPNITNKVGTGPGETGKLPAHVDNFAIYNKALTPPEITKHHSLKTPGTAGTVPNC